ncbi:MAG TPA: hypothetical protein VHM92_05490 [Allosphingosinicella sp.]|nr:hypothetical protein [Allosphingosinicella sp.]
MALRTLFLTGAAIGAAVLGAAAFGQAKGGPAVYWMSADTVSGFGALAADGGRPSAGAVMGAMMGRGGGGGASYSRTLTLQLGSPQRPAGAPSAEHLPPGGLLAGPSLPLITPQGVARPVGPAQPWSGQMEKPRGRMLIYWGCGEHARPGQPAVIDFASLSAGKMPPAFASAMLKPMTPPSGATFTTYGEWPNERTKSRVPKAGSLVGEHVVRGNYSPEMRFTLGPGQDFLAPVGLTANAPAPSGSVPLVWRPVPGARAWFAATMGSGANGDFVMWSSSEAQAAAMAVDYVAEADLPRLIQQRALMPASADRCTVPAEVARAAPQSMLMLIAFGGEANFVQPKPAGTPASWRPAWTAKLRTKSTHMGLLGMTMPGIDDSAGQGPGDPAQPKKKKSKLGRIRDIMGQ